MNNITYINAGAGSGKTYKLTHILADLIKDGKVVPEQVIMTTFTTKAAAEIKERAKAVLYKDGQYDKASRLDHALIGTVHSVCQQMIQKYWFRFGISPNINVLTDEDADFYVSQSLSDLSTDAELKFLHEYCENFDIRRFEKSSLKDFNYEFWQTHLKKIIELTINYELADYSKSIAQSLNFLHSFVKKGVNINISDQDLDTMIVEARDYVTGSNRIKKKDDYYAKFDNIGHSRHNKNIAWYKDVAKTFKTEYGGTCERISTLLANLWGSETVYEYQEKYVTLMFNLAERWREQYAQYKKEKNLIDYYDMEKYMHNLLNIDDVKNDISSSYKYLFVDEFQDSSPIQVKIFDALSDLVGHSYWVGDYKQAIYGFRGTDTTLTKAVVDRISNGSNGCNTESLATSYRSLPDIVNLNNAIFENVFSNTLNVNNITLNVSRKNDDKIKSLRYIKTENFDVAHHVAKIMHVMHEGVYPKDIAVLARSNAELSKVSAALNELGIKSNFADASLCETKTYALVESLLRVLNSDNDTLAKAQVAYLTEYQCGVKEIIEHRLERGDEFMDDVKLLLNLKKIKPRLQQQSVAKMVESLIIELNLFNIIKGVEENQSLGASSLDAIISASRAYEDHCVKMNVPATIDGFILYVRNTDVKVAGDSEGVQLSTYHSSKGLQWKYVIMMSLDHDITNENIFVRQNIFGVKAIQVEKPSVENQYPETFIRFVPWIYSSAKKAYAPSEIQQIVSAMPCFDVEYQDNIEENKRLFYVGMTRPRDVLILDVNGKNPFAVPMALNPNHNPNPDQSGNGWDIFGTGHEFIDYTFNEDDAKNLELLCVDPKNKMLGIICDEKKHDKLPARYVSPSGIHEITNVLSYKDFGKRVILAGNPEMNVVGNCIHQIFAGMEEPRPAHKVEMSETIDSYGLTGVITSPEEIVEAWKNLISFLKEKHGDAVKTYHERPFRLERNGQTIVGSIDFVYQTKDGDILVDFKTCPMGRNAIINKGEHYAGNYGGQINAYTEALTAAGEKVVNRYLYYPVSGLVVEV